MRIRTHGVPSFQENVNEDDMASRAIRVADAVCIFMHIECLLNMVETDFVNNIVKNSFLKFNLEIRLKRKEDCCSSWGIGSSCNVVFTGLCGKGPCSWLLKS